MNRTMLALLVVCAISAEPCLAQGHVGTPPSPGLVDSDEDGIPDGVENILLQRFRPYYRFSMSNGKDEGSRPADAIWFLERSDLQDHHSETDTPLIKKTAFANDNWNLLLNAWTQKNKSASLAANPVKTNYYLNIENSARPGETDWNAIMTNATGLYGHVAPLRAGDGRITSYKVEYWQLYAFNPVPGQLDCYAVSDAHEGDWEGVELVVALDMRTVMTVRHNIHSSHASFDLSKAKGPPKPIGENVVEYVGPNEARWKVSLISDGPLGGDHAQNSLLRMYCEGTECTHPVAYIEHGGHAMWPTEYWEWPGVLNHDGNSPHAYLVATPPNLGEIGHPNLNCPSCQIVVHFNGHWGACGKDPPEGPPLHGSWGKAD